MIGFLVFVMGFSTVWIMWSMHTRVRELEDCVNAVCRGLDDLRFEIIEKEHHGKK